MNRTPEQLRAIGARGRVMVSASAGAGKTSVMIERLADVISGGVSLDNVLAVTFTKKAAAQMKTKLRSELISRLRDADESLAEHLKVQLNKLNQAEISTIHSFCAKLIRTYFYVADVDAAFEIIAEGGETQELMQSAMDALFDKLYEADDERLLYALKRLRHKRTDEGLRRMIVAAYSRARILPDYADVLENSADKTFSEEGFKSVCSDYAEWRKSRCLALAGQVESFAEGFMPALNGEKYHKVLAEAVETLKGVAAEKDVFIPLPRLTRTNKPAVKPETSEDDARFSAFMSSVRGEYSALSSDISDEQTERMRYFESGGLASAFCYLLRGFDGEYAAVKREEGKLDYADLEQITYNLLKYGDGDVRAQVNLKYRYVFVDEYQDVNPIQDAIIDMVASGDVFMVGDVKQAIYGFRGSKSKIFTDKCRQAEEKGDFIVLPDNFRSSPEVIDFVNRLFSRVMARPLSDIDYAKGHAMRGGSRYGEGYRGNAKILLFDKAKEEREQAEGVYSVLGHRGGVSFIPSGGLAVLAAVKRARGETYFDPDSGQEKRVEAGDICVLTRKRSNKSVQAIVRVLSAAGYSVRGAAEQNICDLAEIRQILDILSYIDDSRQDIPLASAMLSPLGAFSEEELAEIRILSGSVPRGTPFRDLVVNYGQTHIDGLAIKINKFLQDAERLRRLSDYLGAAALIDEITAKGGFVGKFSSAERMAALRRLQSEAYSPSGELSLAAFLAKLRANAFEVTMPSSPTANSITVMTMHASKGLEFPVVIVADISESFEGDSSSDMPFDEKYGFAPRYYDVERGVYFNTMLRRVLAIEERAEELGNEINLFYVACTRAKYSLYILSGSTEYDAVSAISADCYSSLFDIAQYDPEALQTVAPTEGGEGAVRFDTSRADEALEKELVAQFVRTYPHESGADLPVKSSASRLVRFDSEDDLSPRLFVEDAPSGGRTGIERGIAYHRFLELCDFAVKDGEGIARQLDEWLREGLITDAQRSLLDVGRLETILSMPVFDFGKGCSLYREREFICRLPSGGYRALERGEKATLGVGEDDGNGVIVQGAIDLLSVRYEGDRAVHADIIDYKFSSHGDEYILKKYAPQLRLYRQVTATVCGLEDKDITTTVVNIFANRCIPVD